MSEYTYTHVGRNDLGGVGGGESLEDTPGDTADTRYQFDPKAPYMYVHVTDQEHG